MMTSNDFKFYLDKKMKAALKKGGGGRRKGAKVQAIAEVVEVKPIDVLTNLKRPNGETYLTKTQAERLLALENKRGDPMVDVRKETNFYHLMTLIEAHGFEQVMEELEKTSVLENYLIQKNFAGRDAFSENFTRSGLKDPIQKGHYECFVCKRRGLDSRNTIPQAKPSRGDEADTIQIQCMTCGTQRILR